ncbi:MAG: HAMP domain-containing protein [Lachnospiraceae bacterium]|nr:HAMP domain-containing protein [Lachnospiraceae bacterium]
MKFHKTLYLKFLLTYLLFGILGFILISVATSRMILHVLVMEKASRMYSTAQLIATDYGMELGKALKERDDALRELTRTAGYSGCDIRIIDNQGRQILYSGDNEGSVTSSVISEFDAVSAGTYYMTGDFYGVFNEPHLSVFYPITYRFKVMGYVIAHAPMEEITVLSNRLLNVSYITFLAIFILSLILLILFSHAVYIPLRKTIRAAEEYAGGNMDYPLEINRRDEMGYLSGTLNFMAHEIARSEDDQRKFISNVSHDFRSPLTSIRGYLAAMIDGTIPLELHEKYLTIVLNETERLTKLTNGLLELNSLNEKGMILTITDFDINSMIKHTCETFEVQCDRKKIAFELILSGHELFVNADADKIQQVLYNLIDNAIKFSHTNSIIKIETTEKNDKAFISVKDSGIGIPKDSIKLVFDRFYKTDLSRGKDKKGTGLGLAITKEIIQAHNQNINVISTEGVGSEFIFTLKISETEE